jgi:hypothetical protein
MKSFKSQDLNALCCMHILLENNIYICTCTMTNWEELFLLAILTTSLRKGWKYDYVVRLGSSQLPFSRPIKLWKGIKKKNGFQYNFLLNTLPTCCLGLETLNILNLMFSFMTFTKVFRNVAVVISFNFFVRNISEIRFAFFFFGYNFQRYFRCYCILFFIR